MKNKNSKILGWQIEQTRSLIEFVFKNKDKSLTTVFEEWSKNNGRQTFSVRNYYYKLVKYVNENEKICEFLNIKKEHLVQAFSSKHFSDLQSIELLKKILPNRPPCSVRARCHHLANGDLDKMIRYQNKYRNLIFHNKDLVLRVMNELNEQDIQTRNPYNKEKPQNKILNMPIQDSGLRDDEIQALFSGLVRLIKNNAEKKVSNQLMRETEFANSTLQVTLANLRRKDLLLQDVMMQNDKLKDDLRIVQDNLAKTKAQSLSNLMQLQSIEKSQKMDDLKKHIAELTAQVEGTVTQPRK